MVFAKFSFISVNTYCMDLDFFTSNIASAINVHQKYKLNPINAKRKTHNFSIFANSVGGDFNKYLGNAHYIKFSTQIYEWHTLNSEQLFYFAF